MFPQGQQPRGAFPRGMGQQANFRPGMMPRARAPGADFLGQRLLQMRPQMGTQIQQMNMVRQQTVTNSTSWGSPAMNVRQTVNTGLSVRQSVNVGGQHRMNIISQAQQLQTHQIQANQLHTQQIRVQQIHAQTQQLPSQQVVVQQISSIQKNQIKTQQMQHMQSHFQNMARSLSGQPGTLPVSSPHVYQPRNASVWRCPSGVGDKQNRPPSSESSQSHGPRKDDYKKSSSSAVRPSSENVSRSSSSRDRSKGRSEKWEYKKYSHCESLQRKSDDRRNRKRGKKRKKYSDKDDTSDDEHSRRRTKSRRKVEGSRGSDSLNKDDEDFQSDDKFSDEEFDETPVESEEPAKQAQDDTPAWIRCSPADLYFVRDSETGNLTATKKMSDLEDKFEQDIVKRAERAKESRPEVDVEPPPPRHHKMHMHFGDKRDDDTIDGDNVIETVVQDDELKEGGEEEYIMVPWSPSFDKSGKTSAGEILLHLTSDSDEGDDSGRHEVDIVDKSNDAWMMESAAEPSTVVSESCKTAVNSTEELTISIKKEGVQSAVDHDHVYNKMCDEKVIVNSTNEMQEDQEKIEESPAIDKTTKDRRSGKALENNGNDENSLNEEIVKDGSKDDGRSDRIDDSKDSDNVDIKGQTDAIDIDAKDQTDVIDSGGVEEMPHSNGAVLEDVIVDQQLDGENMTNNSNIDSVKDENSEEQLHTDVEKDSNDGLLKNATPVVQVAGNNDLKNKYNDNDINGIPDQQPSDRTSDVEGNVQASQTVTESHNTKAVDFTKSQDLDNKAAKINLVDQKHPVRINMVDSQKKPLRGKFIVIKRENLRKFMSQKKRHQKKYDSDTESSATSDSSDSSDDGCANIKDKEENPDSDICATRLQELPQADGMEDVVGGQECVDNNSSYTVPVTTAAPDFASTNDYSSVDETAGGSTGVHSASVGAIGTDQAIPYSTESPTASCSVTEDIKKLTVTKLNSEIDLLELQKCNLFMERQILKMKIRRLKKSSRINPCKQFFTHPL